MGQFKLPEMIIQLMAQNRVPVANVGRLLIKEATASIQHSQVSFHAGHENVIQCGNCRGNISRDFLCGGEKHSNPPTLQYIPFDTPR
jgi:hypothetical protein